MLTIRVVAAPDVGGLIHRQSCGVSGSWLHARSAVRATRSWSRDFIGEHSADSDGRPGRLCVGGFRVCLGRETGAFLTGDFT